MKLIVIGDIHGRTVWKTIHPENYDKIIFLGDYCDTRDKNLSARDVCQNLIEIIEFKKQNPDKVVLLIGNHDLMYIFLHTYGYGCSGYMAECAEEQFDLFKTNWSLFQPAYQIGKHLFTHAGVSNQWWENNKAAIETFQQAYGFHEPAETFNAMWEQDSMRRILAQVGYERGARFRGCKGGIFWADRNETKDDSLTGYRQYVGHTPIDRIELFGDPSSDTTIRYCDVLGFKTEFYEFEYKEG